MTEKRDGGVPPQEKILPPNFSEGPISIYGVEGELPKGFDIETARRELDQWKEVLSEQDFAKRQDLAEGFLEDEREKNPEGFASVRYYYCGKAVQTPATSGGRGEYYYWEEWDSCYIDTREQEQAGFDKEREIISWYNLDVRIALKATPEERQQWEKQVAQWRAEHPAKG